MSWSSVDDRLGSEMNTRMLSVVSVLTSCVLVFGAAASAQAAPAASASGPSEGDRAKVATKSLTDGDAADTGSYEEADAAVVLEGDGWRHVVDSHDSGGGSASSTSPGRAALEFTGTAISVISRKSPESGVAVVTLDGAEVARTDMYAPAAEYQAILWQSSTLSSGDHRIEVSWTPEKNPSVTVERPQLLIDRFITFDSGATSTPVAVDARADGNAIAVDWQGAPDFRVHDFVIDRRSDGEDGEWETLASVAGDKHQFVDRAVVSGDSYEYAVSARNEVGNRSTQQVSEPVALAAAAAAAGVGTYQEDSSAVTLSGTWTRTAHSRDLGGASAYITSTGSASFTFTGPAVTLLGRKTPSSGFVNVIVDGRSVASVDRYAAANEYQQTIWSSTSLEAGQHTIELQWTSKVNPAVTTSTPSLSLDAFVVPATEPPSTPSGLSASSVDGGIRLTWSASDDAAVKGYRLWRTDAFGEHQMADVAASESQFTDNEVVAGESVTYRLAVYDEYGNESAKSDAVSARMGEPAATGTYEENSGQLRLLGPWVRTVHSADSGGASSYIVSAGSASMTFTGTSVRWISRTGPKAGIAEVYIDGTRVAQVDRYASANQYQKVAWQTSSLSAGTHRIDIRWTGQKNPASGGSSITVDSIVVPPQGPPSPPSTVAARAYQSGARVEWTAPSGAIPSSYLVYRINSSGRTTKIAELAPSNLSYVDPGLPVGQSFRYAVTVVDLYGLESSRALTGSVKSTGGLPSRIWRAEDCPAATVTVGTAAELKDALAKAQPGTSIRLSPGTYEGSFRLETSGTTVNPIWVCGSESSVIKPNTLVRGTGLYITGSDVVIAGLAISTSLKGVMVVGAHRVTIADLKISDIGDEAVHFRNSSSNGVLVGTSIARTGRTNPAFGEGVYIGTSSKNWCAYNACAVDRSNGITVVDNVLSETTAESIEVKEGVQNTVIQGNTVTTAVAGTSDIQSAIQVKGNDNVVTGNTITANRPFAIRVLFAGGDWGLRNVISGNSATLRSSSTAMISLATRDNFVRCTNTVAPSSLPLGTDCVW